MLNPLSLDIRLASVGYRTNEGEATAILHDLSLKVSRGECVAIMGPSGVGKTTLLKLALGIVEPFKGMCVSSFQVKDDNPAPGVLFQVPGLLPWFSAMENTLLPIRLMRRRNWANAKSIQWYLVRANELYARAGLSDAAQKLPSELSGGMLHRVALCRALVSDPSHLVLDEPFRSVDSLMREKLWDLYLEFSNEKRRSVILATHDFREACLLADRIVLLPPMKDGVVPEMTIPLHERRNLETLRSREFIETESAVRDWYYENQKK